MKVICKTTRRLEENKPDSKQHTLLTMNRIVPGKYYLVMGISYGITTSADISLEIPDEHYVLDAPLALFDIVDERPSHYWRAKKFGEHGLHLWPEAFYIDCFHDRLSDGDPELIPIYRELRARMESEFDDNDKAL
jgi:hypothetical protein